MIVKYFCLSSAGTGQKCERYRGVCSGNSISFPSVQPCPCRDAPLSQRGVPVCVSLYKNGDKLLHITWYRGQSFSKAKIIHSSQKVEATQLSIDKWVDKRNVVSPCNVILFSLKMGRNSDTCYKMHDPWGHMLREIIQLQRRNTV